MRLTNKTAIVTGGGSGIGRAIAIALAREGAKVVIAGRTQDKLDRVVQEIGLANCLAVRGDTGDAADNRKLAEAAVKHFGGIHILVNNAGVLLAGTAESHTDDEWEQTFNINVRGVWQLSRAVLPHMRTAGGGSIINLGSVLSLVAARNRVAYATSKGAVLALTKAMALDHAPEKIRVNCICPAIVETEMVARFGMDEAARRQRIAMHPIGRFGQPEDVAGAAVFLASDEAAWITGAAFPVDGGYTAI
ncbi:MAG TPA: SDR family oxidoreductase [Candidatus Saccharimonadales bacterium]|jgi:NAD(P)-dependent dehydrogenase (short-subunit alcohol dehydrogenase family)|nr:SDR family oxidoreductase [Candidatus Saccharimonadales bacterium]